MNTGNKSTLRVGVLGAGVVGMTVAKLAQEQFPGAQVTVVADQFRDDTLSTIAAGIFRPGTSFKGPTKEITKEWIDGSWHYWHDLLSKPDAPKAGVMPFLCYIFSKEHEEITRNHLMDHLVPDFKAVGDDELKLVGEGYKYGSRFTTLKVDCSLHLPWLERIFLDKNGKFIQSKVDSFASVQGKFDLLFNCTGFGAKRLCNDHDLVPIRGQVIKVKAPWLKTAFYGDYDTYVIPGFNGIATLGGVRQYDSYDLNVSKYDKASIWERCVKLVPGLSKAEVVAHRVGLRPHRVPVRVEPELVSGSRVVHCYGHGGYGVTCAPGTAAHAVRIALDLHKTNFRNKL